MKIAFNNLPVYNFSTPKYNNISFSSNSVDLPLNNDEFFYEDEIKHFGQKSFVDYLTEPEQIYGREIQPPVLSRVIHNYDDKAIHDIYAKLNDESDRYIVSYFILNEINDSLTFPDVHDYQKLLEVLKASLNCQTHSERNNVIADVVDEVGNSIIANLMYQKDTKMLEFLLPYMDDETLSELLTQTNICDEYPIGKENNITKHSISKDTYHNGKTKKVKVSKKAIEIIRKRVVDILKNDNIKQDTKIKLCYIYAPRENEKKDETYPQFIKYIRNYFNL